MRMAANEAVMFSFGGVDSLTHQMDALLESNTHEGRFSKPWVLSKTEDERGLEISAPKVVVGAVQRQVFVNATGGLTEQPFQTKACICTPWSEIDIVGVTLLLRRVVLAKTHDWWGGCVASQGCSGAIKQHLLAFARVNGLMARLTVTLYLIGSCVIKRIQNLTFTTRLHIDRSRRNTNITTDASSDRARQISAQTSVFKRPLIFILFAISRVVTAQNASPSSSPTIHTTTPSASPTHLEIITEDLFNIVMSLEGLPLIITNETNATIVKKWQSITSQHVMSYWISQDYIDFNVTSVVTNLENQVSLFEEDDKLTSSFIYDQRIQYTVRGPDSPIALNETNSTMLFFIPFEEDSEEYVDSLREGFDLDDDVKFLGLSLVPDTSPSSTPTQETVGERDGLESEHIVAIVVSVLAFLFLMSALAIWCVTQIKPEEQQESEPKANVQDESAPQQEPEGVHSRQESEPETADGDLSKTEEPKREEDKDNPQAEFFFL